MKRLSPLALALALLVPPAVLAHDPAGTPKNYCEVDSETDTHDYASPATGTFLAFSDDGNVGGDCNGDTTPADYDGHPEWAVGGAWIAVDSGDGFSGGSLACFGEVGHHSSFGPFTVSDLVLGNTIPFTVTSDLVNLVPPLDPTEADCGDFESDAATACIGTCTVTFPAGLDGMYQVYAGDAVAGSVGTAGHVVVPGGGTGGWGRGAPGVAAYLQFDGVGGRPEMTPGPGWTCTEPTPDADLWSVDCAPSGLLGTLGDLIGTVGTGPTGLDPGQLVPETRAVGLLPDCTSPMGTVGGTPASFGSGTVRVSCRDFFSGMASATCSTTWMATGGCAAPLTGFYQFPLRCSANVVGSAVLGNLFAACIHL